MAHVTRKGAPRKSGASLKEYSDVKWIQGSKKEDNRGRGEVRVNEASMKIL